jgi:hypothetical protein
MRRLEETLAKDSCLNRALDEELVFVLLGRDASAASAIRYWASHRVATAKNQRTDPEIVEAFKLADQMDKERSFMRGRIDQRREDAQAKR